MNVGIFGGSFSPITEGHIEVAQYVLKSLDKVIFVPCNNHPWGKNLIDFKHRFEMCRLAIEYASSGWERRENEKMEVQDYEQRYKLPGDTFSLITKLKELPRFKKSELFLVIGMDEANAFSKWKNYKELHELLQFIIVPRPGVKMAQNVESFFKTDHILPPDLDLRNVSSTFIRIELEGYYKFKEITPNLIYNLNPKVFEYIKENNLYKD